MAGKAARRGAALRQIRTLAEQLREVSPLDSLAREYAERILEEIHQGAVARNPETAGAARARRLR